MEIWKKDIILSLLCKVLGFEILPGYLIVMVKESFFNLEKNGGNSELYTEGCWKYAIYIGTPT